MSRFKSRPLTGLRVVISSLSAAAAAVWGQPRPESQAQFKLSRVEPEPEPRRSHAGHGRGPARPWPGPSEPARIRSGTQASSGTWTPNMFLKLSLTSRIASGGTRLPGPVVTIQWYASVFTGRNDDWNSSCWSCGRQANLPMWVNRFLCRYSGKF